MQILKLVYLKEKIIGLYASRCKWLYSRRNWNNIFIVKDRKVFTPKGVHALRGITRNYVMKLCEQLKIPIYETDIEPFDLYNADEAFVTATPFCMIPLVSLNSIQIGSGRRGKIFSKILKFWSEKVDVDIEKQIKNWETKSSNDKLSPYKFK
jgi:branched-chain amino acid aminotransferase